jgi:hypothetical protein
MQSTAAPQRRKMGRPVGARDSRPRVRRRKAAAPSTPATSALVVPPHPVEDDSTGSPPRLLAMQPVETLKAEYDMSSYDEYDRSYNEYARLCLTHERKERTDIAAVAAVAEGLTVLDGNRAYDRLVFPLHNHVFVYCPITAAHDKTWALFEELFREFAKARFLMEKIVVAKKLDSDTARVARFMTAMSLRMERYVFVVSAGGRIWMEAISDIGVDSFLRRCLLDLNECAVCSNQNSKWNTSCRHCQRWICSPCGQRLDVCPFCRCETPGFYRASGGAREV